MKCTSVALLSLVSGGHAAPFAFSRTLGSSAVLPRLSSLDLLWAVHSTTEHQLFDLCVGQGFADHTWETLEPLGVAFWVSASRSMSRHSYATHRLVALLLPFA